MDVSDKEIWIFLSHSSADFDKVRLIRNYLEEKSFRPLMFYLKCLESEEETFNLIKREIDVRTRFILCDSKNARASKWVKKEMDYISNTFPERSYEILDLSKPLEQITDQIDAYTQTTNIFISYSRAQQSLFEKVCERLSKYDLRVFDPELDMTNDMSFSETIETAITNVSKCGFYILLADDDALKSQWVMKELDYAVKSKSRICIIALSFSAFEKCKKDSLLSNYKIVNLHDSSLRGSFEDIVTDMILSLVLSPGALMTHQQNFSSGKNCILDKDEAARLVGVLIQSAEDSPNPSAIVFLAESYEYGRHGFPVDLKKASNYYSLAIHEGGRNDLIPHAKELNRQIEGEMRK